jgi:hypothetical protein
LIVVGDHRKMEIPDQREVDRYGRSTYGRTVLTVVGTGIKPNSIVYGLFQHHDIAHSLRKHIGTGKRLISSLTNDIFD